jgi:hypothetical protein
MGGCSDSKRQNITRQSMSKAFAAAYVDLADRQ